MDGRLIVISTIRAADELNNNRAPDEAELFVYDVNEQKIVRRIVPAPKGRTTELVVEVEPGRLLGLTTWRGRPGLASRWHPASARKRGQEPNGLLTLDRTGQAVYNDVVGFSIPVEPVLSRVEGYRGSSIQ